MKKILFSDMDGTFINNRGLLYDKDKEMVDKLKEAGHLFVFNTGRNFEEAKRSINELSLTYDYLVLNNGGHIVDKFDNDLFKKVIDNNTGVNIIKHCLNYDDLWIYYFNGNKTLAYNNGQTYIYQGDNNIIPTKDLDFIKEYQKVTEFDIIAINQDDKQTNKLIEIQKYIEDNYKEYAHGTLNTHYLDITPSSCSKGTGIKVLTDLLDEEIISYAIGDSFNDLSMFEFANYGYTFNHVDESISKYAYKQVDNVTALIEDMLK